VFRVEGADLEQDIAFKATDQGAPASPCGAGSRCAQPRLLLWRSASYSMPTSTARSVRSSSRLISSSAKMRAVRFSAVGSGYYVGSRQHRRNARLAPSQVGSSIGGLRPTARPCGRRLRISP
jgi:hypothetical protein